MDENCGPLHDGCECEDECPECGGALEEDNHICDCRHCNFEGDDEFRCLGCEKVWDEDQIRPVREAQRHRETKALADWNAWATGAKP